MSHSQPPNVSVFSKSLFTHKNTHIGKFSVNKFQIISKLKDWNSHLALKAALTSRYDVNSVNLNIASNRKIQGIRLLLMQNNDKVVASKEISCSYSC